MAEYIFDYLIPIVTGYLLGDFLVGIFHWLKDTYFDPLTPIIGKTFIWPSRLHHIKPRHILEYSDLELYKNSAMWTFLWMWPLFLMTEEPTFILSLFITISLNDIAHKYAHVFERKPAFISFLQKVRVFQSYQEHHLHHMEPHNVNYCPITPHVNFILEKINFWRTLEYIIEKYLNIEPRKKTYDFVDNPNFLAGIEFVPIR